MDDAKERLTLWGKLHGHKGLEKIKVLSLLRLVLKAGRFII